jgi:hypothetical protein
MTYNHELRVLEANIASAEGRVGVLLSSMDQWNTPQRGKPRIKGMLSPETITARERQIDNLRINIREWRRLAESIKRTEMN